MTEQTETEKLRERIVEILYGELTYKNYLTLPILQHNADLKVNEVLKACKEAGLQFVVAKGRKLTDRELSYALEEIEIDK